MTNPGDLVIPVEERLSRLERINGIELAGIALLVALHLQELAPFIRSLGEVAGFVGGAAAATVATVIFRGRIL